MRLTPRPIFTMPNGGYAFGLLWKQKVAALNDINRLKTELAQQASEDYATWR